MKPKHLKPEMALAVLEDRKTQTRMPCKPQPVTDDPEYQETPEIASDGTLYFSKLYLNIKPKYRIGDVLYIRERARLKSYTWGDNGRYNEVCFDYEADNSLSEWVKFPKRLKMLKQGHCVPNGCFRELARTFVEITGVRVERIQDISTEDIWREGINKEEYDQWYEDAQCIAVPAGTTYQQPKDLFENLWDSCYHNTELYSWKANPWVFVFDFERCDKPCQ